MDWWVNKVKEKAKNKINLQKVNSNVNASPALQDEEVR